MFWEDFPHSWKYPYNQWGFDFAVKIRDSEGRGFSIYISNSEISKSNFSWPSIRFASNSSENQYWVDSLVVWVFLTCSLNLKSFSSIQLSSVLEIMRSCGLQCFLFLFVEMCERIPSNIRGHYVSFFPSVWRGLDGGEKTSNHEGENPLLSPGNLSPVLIFIWFHQSMMSIYWARNRFYWMALR